MPRGGSRIGAGRPKRSAAMLKLAGVTRSDRLPAKPASVNTQRRKQDIETQYGHVAIICHELHQMISDPDARGSHPLGALLRE